MCYRILFVLVVVGGLSSCQHILPDKPEDYEVLDGPIEGLSTAEKLSFIAGDGAFNNEVFTAENGLGPYFVATTCGSCHAGDGKGHPFTTLTRFGQHDATGNHFLDRGGPQLQNRSLPGYLPEKLPSGAPFARFIPPAVTGLGFLAALTDQQILTNADENDANGDGISGVPNYISPPDYFVPLWIHQIQNGQYIGRFGKKAAAIDLLHQTVNAYNEDMGITSDYLPFEPHINGVGYPYADPTPEPEVPASTVLNVVSYLRMLKAPVQRDQQDPDVLAGKVLFTTIGCNKCHTPQWTTLQSDIAGLSHKTFYPYTDLLLHDMGSELDDGYTEGSALTSEWRTPPLWGLGLSKNSQGGQYYLMHDGRARDISQAILLHGGEGTGSRAAFTSLPEAERQKLIRFLESL